MSETAKKIFVGCDLGFEPGDTVLVTGCIDLATNCLYIVKQVRCGNLLVWAASPWQLLKYNFRREWIKFRWWLDDAYLELCDLWDDAKQDWRRL